LRFRFLSISNRKKSNRIEISMIWFLDNWFDSIRNQKSKSNQSIWFEIRIISRRTFHRIRKVDVESKNLTTFRIRFEVYKYRMLSFNLCNESTTYQHYMNDVFFDYLNDFVFAYIDDILIYNDSKIEYIDHVKKMLQRLRNAELQADINKCEFFVHEIK
jgi:hypothetical protein